MSEWQPARWQYVHPRDVWTLDWQKKYESQVIHVRPASSKPVDRLCESERFYDVQEYPGLFTCDCETLTD
jgi:hypothetical protein